MDVVAMVADDGWYGELWRRLVGIGNATCQWKPITTVYSKDCHQL